MQTIMLTGKRIRLRLDGQTHQVTMEREGQCLPWRIDLAPTATLTAGRPGAANPHRSCPVDLNSLELRLHTPTRLQWIGRIGGADIAVEIQIDGDAVVFAISPTGMDDNQVISANWPGAIRLEADTRESIWANHSQGALFRADGREWQSRQDMGWAAMRCFGLTGNGHGLAGIIETPTDATLLLADDGRRSMQAQVQWEPSLGTLAYRRQLRLEPLPEPGAVALAKVFRAYACRHGLWKSFEERVAENPTVGLLKGAAMLCAGYYHDDGADHVGVMRRFKQAGFERAYLFSPRLRTFGKPWLIADLRYNSLSDDQIRQIESLGYVTAPFLQVESSETSIGQDKFLVDAQGKTLWRWQLGETCYYEIAKWQVPEMLSLLDDQVEPAAAVHFDTLAAMPLAEHYGHRSYDRRGDVQLRIEIARHYRRFGKMVASECMKDWGNPVLDLGTSKFFGPYADATNRVWNVPLTDLVYHDSVIRSHWEHHSYDDPRLVSRLWERRWHPFGLELNDLLTASPPVLFPEGQMYAWELQEVTLPDGRKDTAPLMTSPVPYKKRFSDAATQAALPKALRVCQMNLRHGTARMMNHRFLDPGGPFVQESEFDTGLHVVINYSDQPYSLPDGRTVQGRSAIVDE